MRATVVDGRQRWDAETLDAALRWARALAAATGRRVRVLVADGSARANGGRR